MAFMKAAFVLGGLPVSRFEPRPPPWVHDDPGGPAESTADQDVFKRVAFNGSPCFATMNRRAPDRAPEGHPTPTPKRGRPMGLADAVDDLASK